jgi:hypothetical protein
MTTTLGDLRAASVTKVATGTDSTTPPGTAYAVAVTLDVPTTYLLLGRADDEQARVIGRIESHGSCGPTAYCGGGLRGGTLVAGPSQDCATLFAAIAERSPAVPRGHPQRWAQLLPATR